jgi:hypothetical protein
MVSTAVNRSHARRSAAGLRLAVPDHTNADLDLPTCAVDSVGMSAEPVGQLIVYSAS